ESHLRFRAPAIGGSRPEGLLPKRRRRSSRFRSSSSLSLTVSEIDYDKLSALKRKFFKNNYLMARISARGGLEPHFRVLFSAIFHGVPWRISIRVETCGK